MQKRPWEISDLLALDEGKPFDASIDPTDATVQQTLTDIQRLRADLQSLPDVGVDESVWQIPLAQKSRGRVWLHFPLATAASVFFASVMGIYLLFGGPQTSNDGFAGNPEFAVTSSLDNSGIVLAGLMRQSRDLERQLYGSNPLSQASDVRSTSINTRPQDGSLTQMLLIRLADVDGQIATLYDATEMDQERRQILWQKRVDLLESLVAVRGGSDPGVYDNARSM